MNTISKSLVIPAIVAFALVGVYFSATSIAFADGEETGWFDSYEYYTPDTGWYDTGDYYTPDTGWYDSYDYYAPDTGWYDSAEYYTPETGWYDSYDYYTPETAWYDSYDYYTPNVVEEGSDLIYGYTDEFGTRYSYSDSFAQSYSTPSCFTCQQSYAQPRPSFASASSPPPIQVRNPSFPPSYPPVSYPPAPQPPRPQPQPPVSYPPAPSSNLTTNTCVGNSCNTNVNNVDNSINGSFNSTQLAQATPQYLVQYTYPPVVPPAPIYPQQGLYCVITASPSNIQNGQAAILSWTSYGGATSAWLSDGIGALPPNGTLAVRPNISTTYTLTVSGYGGTRTCTTYVNVSGVPYVSLSQIPYTGFDLGTFGNAIYWLGLLAFAAASAYLVLYYKGGAAVFVSSLGIIGNRSIARVHAEKAPVMFGKSAAPKAFTPTYTPRIPETRPIARAEVSPKDSMTFAGSSNGDAPRIVVNRG